MVQRSEHAVWSLLRQREFSAASYLIGWKCSNWLPAGFMRTVFRVGADFAARKPAATATLRANLSRVVGVEKHDDVPAPLVRAAMRSYARYWMEAFRLPAMVKQGRQWGRRRGGTPQNQLLHQLDSSVMGAQLLDASLQQGRGVILTLPHSGNWDMAGLWLVHHAGGFTTVAERLKPEAVYQAFVDFRTQLGFEVVPLRGGPKPKQVLAQKLRQGEIVCLLGERDITRHGIQVEFFGETAQVPTGPAALALETGAALHPVRCLFKDDGGWDLAIHPAIDVAGLSAGRSEQEAIAAITRAVLMHFERDIAQRPQDWHMLQRMFVADRQQPTT